jgi:intracellular sulfur oxidation DsrE/DsrF family protein
MLGLLALGAVGCVTTPEKQKVAYHVNGDDDKLLNATLGNIQNHINAVGKDNLDLRVVMHGNGLALLQKAKSDEGMKSKIDNLKLQGVAFNVCANTLKSKKLDYTKDLHDVKQKDIVPSGVAEIAILQSKGFAYVKP